MPGLSSCPEKHPVPEVWKEHPNFLRRNHIHYQGDFVIRGVRTHVMCWVNSPDGRQIPVFRMWYTSRDTEFFADQIEELNAMRERQNQQHKNLCKLERMIFPAHRVY